MLGQASHDDGFHLRTELEVGTRAVQGYGRLREELCEHLAWSLRQIGKTPRQEEICNRRQTVLVCCRSDEFSAQRLGRDVHECTYEEAGPSQPLIGRCVGRRRDPEVEELHLPRFGIVHHVVGLQVAMDNASGMGGLHSITDLQHDSGNFLAGKRCISLGVAFEDLPACPLDGEKVQPRSCLACFDCAHHIWVLYAGAEVGLAQKPRDSCPVLSKLLAKDLQRHDAVLRMVGPIDRGGSTLPDHVLDGVPRQGGPDKRIARHAANLTSAAHVGKRSSVCTTLYCKWLPHHSILLAIQSISIPSAMSAQHTGLRVLGLIVAILPIVGACGSNRRPPRAAIPEAQMSRPSNPTLPDAVRLYRQMGLLAEGGDTPFVGSVSFLGARAPDSTIFLLTVSVPTRALTFVRENERYRAGYTATLTLTRQTESARRFETHHIVRVASFKETTRSDESVLYQQIVLARPGTHELSFVLRDDAGGKGSSIEATVNIPRIGPGSLSSPIPIYDVAARTTVDSLPRIVPAPRATVTFGQDTVLPIYVEAYGGDAAFPLRAAVYGENASSAVWSDTAVLPRRGELFSGIVSVPITRLGVGVLTLALTTSNGSDTVRAPLFVTFGEDLPVATFTEMVGYLRYFASLASLQTLRDAAPDARAGVWAAFLRETDPDPATAVNERLRDYFGRIAQANARFREEGSVGWLSDRGRVFVALGGPDQIYEPNATDMNRRGRAQIWEYQRYRLQLVFIDQTGFGRWRMTSTTESEFESLVRRELTR